eukprot:SAG31_NODE_4938_length_2849_cov_2.097091_3_plen_220_part_00
MCSPGDCRHKQASELPKGHVAWNSTVVFKLKKPDSDILSQQQPKWDPLAPPEITLTVMGRTRRRGSLAGLKAAVVDGTGGGTAELEKLGSTVVPLEEVYAAAVSDHSVDKSDKSIDRSVAILSDTGHHAGSLILRLHYIRHGGNITVSEHAAAALRQAEADAEGKATAAVIEWLRRRYIEYFGFFTRPCFSPPLRRNRCLAFKCKKKAFHVMTAWREYL